MSRPSASRDNRGLNIREATFVDHYVASNGNGAEAARAAGFAGDLKKRAHDLLLRTPVWRAIQQSACARLSHLDVTKERVLLELVRIAFLDPRRFFSRDNKLLLPTLWPEEAAACVSGIEFNREGQVSKIRVCSKNHAVELLGRYMGMLDGD